MSKVITVEKRFCSLGEVYNTVTFEILVDAEDFEFLAQYYWQVCNGYAQGRIDNGEGGVKTAPPVAMHRLIMKPKKGEVVHHINGNRLDNRKSNLQIMTAGDHARHHKTGKALKRPGRNIPLDRRIAIYRTVTDEDHTILFAAEKHGVSTHMVRKIFVNGPY